MTFSQLAPYSDYLLLALRLVVASVFVTSGWLHLRNLRERAKSIGLPRWLTAFVGTIEIVAGAFVGLGILTPAAAALLTATMLGAMYKKIFAWKVGYFADDGVGWHYELLLFLLLLFLLTTNGGSLVIF